MFMKLSSVHFHDTEDEEEKRVQTKMTNNAVGNNQMLCIVIYNTNQMVYTHTHTQR